MYIEISINKYIFIKIKKHKPFNNWITIMYKQFNLMDLPILLYLVT